MAGRRNHGKLVHRKTQVGDVKTYPTESAQSTLMDRKFSPTIDGSSLFKLAVCQVKHKGESKA
jgi:hypothetical protein